MDIKEVNVELEKYINDRVESGVSERFVSSSNYKRANIKRIIDELTKAKKNIEDEHKKALTLWKEAIDVYFEYLKTHRGSRMSQDPPKKPEMSSSYNKIDGYISLFTVLVDDDSLFTVDFLEKVFLEVARGIDEAKKTTAYMAYCSSGSVYAMSDFTLSANDVNAGSWSRD